jgi:hypothetical protein
VKSKSGETSSKGYRLESKERSRARPDASVKALQAGRLCEESKLRVEGEESVT